MAREKNSSTTSEKVREFYFESGKIDILMKSQGKLIFWWKVRENWNNLTQLIYYQWRLEEPFEVSDLNDIFPYNSLTPVLPITARDEPWPFFHCWHHHFWPKLASSILNYCRRKRAKFQWCPDQRDRPNGGWDMHKNAQNDKWKTWAKFPSTTPGCSMVKIGRLDDTFLDIF